MEHVLSATLELRDKLTTNIQRAERSLNSFSNSTKKVKSAFSNMIQKMNVDSKKIAGIQKSMNNFVAKGAIGLVAGTSAIGAFMKSAYMSHVDLQKQLLMNTAISGANVQEQQKLAEQVKYLGKTTVFTALDVAKAQQYQAQMGYKTNQILEMTPQIMKFAIATQQDLATSTDILVSNLNAFGLSIQDSTRFMDVMTATSNNTGADILSLAESFKYIGSTSRNFDSFEDVATILGVLADNGIKGSTSGRTLATVYSRLSKPTKEMRDALKKVGIEVYDKNKKFKGMIPIINEIRGKMGKWTEQQRNLFLTTVFGQESLKVVTSLLGTTKEKLESVNKTVKNSAGSMDKMNTIMGKADDNKVKALESAWDGFKQKLGEGLAPLVNKNMETLTNFLNSLTDSDKLSTENLENFFNTLYNKAKWVAGGFLAAQIALLSLRASMGDPIAKANLGALAIAGVSLGIYEGIKYSEDHKKQLREEFDKKVEKFNQTDFGKRGLQAKQREELISSMTDSTGTSYGATRQLQYEKANEIVNNKLATEEQVLEYSSEVINNYLNNTSNKNYNNNLNNTSNKNYSNSLSNNYNNNLYNNLNKNYSNNYLQNTYQNYTAKNFNPTNLTKILDTPQISKKTDITLNVNMSGIIKDKTQDIDEIVNKATQQFKDSLKDELQNAVATQ